MRAVNLLAYDLSVGSARKFALPKRLLPVLAIGGSTALVAGIAWTFVGASSTASSRADELAAVKAETAAVVARSANTSTDEVAQRRLREAALATALAYRVPWDNVLADIGYLLPRDVWVTALRIQAPRSPVPSAADETAGAAAVASTPQSFLLSGYASSQARVAETLDRLERVPALVDIELQSSAKATVLESETITFTIVGNVREKGATS